jgi:hypothetical protein
MYLSSPPCDGVRRVLLILAIEDEEYNTYSITRLRKSSGLLLLSSSPPCNRAHNILLVLYLAIRPCIQL